MIHRSLQGAPELTEGVTVSSGTPVFERMTDGSDIYFPPNYKNKNKNENKDSNDNVTDTNKDHNKNDSKNEDEIEYNVEYAGSNETNELLYPLFINEAAYNEKDIAFMLMLKIELDLQIISL